MMMGMRLAHLGLTLALLTAASGCDGDEAPAEGSCQMLAAELQEIEDCGIVLGLADGLPESTDGSARCAAEVLGLEDPPEDRVEGLAYQVAYQALCDIHGDDMPQYCEISATLGCEG